MLTKRNIIFYVLLKVALTPLANFPWTPAGIGKSFTRETHIANIDRHRRVVIIAAVNDHRWWVTGGFFDNFHCACERTHTRPVNDFAWILHSYLYIYRQYDESAVHTGK